MARRSSSEAALAELAARYDLPPAAVEQLREFHRVLVDDPLAPTAVRDPDKVIDDHLADSLVALELEPIRSARTLADLGSGAGVPGLPLAIALPGASVALVESAARKCSFLERAIARCSVVNARAVHARAESWPEGIESFDVVTARALGPLEVVVEYAAPLLTLGGTLVVWRGQRDPEAETTAARAAAAVGLKPGEIVAVKPYPTAQNRYLHLMSKVTQTPSGFPRRPGMALKRPLGTG
ncbi:MAG: 16S rRNA (guanine(527)-N(7))-methyltransferase RsmG [Solirubrobacteraceae bacterium]